MDGIKQKIKKELKYFHDIENVDVNIVVELNKNSKFIIKNDKCKVNKPLFTQKINLELDCKLCNKYNLQYTFESCENEFKYCEYYVKSAIIIQRIFKKFINFNKLYVSQNHNKILKDNGIPIFYDDRRVNKVMNDKTINRINWINASIKHTDIHNSIKFYEFCISKTDYVRLTLFIKRVNYEQFKLDQKDISNKLYLKSYSNSFGRHPDNKYYIFEYTFHI